MEIYSSIYGVMMEVITQAGIDVHDIAAIGITNQRETTIVWDKTTGRPIHNAIVWQCRRTAPICDELAARGLTGYIKKTTGLVLDAYFSGTKIKWLLDNVDGAREKAERGELLFGTVDTWLIWKLTEGCVHVTDYTNASRTMLYDIHKLCWDEQPPAGAGHSGVDAAGGAQLVGGLRHLQHSGRGDPHCRDRGRPAGSAVRAVLLRARRREEYIRNGLLFADEYRRAGY